MLSVFSKKKELHFEHMDFYILTGGGQSLDYFMFIQTRTAEKWFSDWVTD